MSFLLSEPLSSLLFDDDFDEDTLRLIIFGFVAFGFDFSAFGVIAALGLAGARFGNGFFLNFGLSCLCFFG